MRNSLHQHLQDSQHKYIENYVDLSIDTVLRCHPMNPTSSEYPLVIVIEDCFVPQSAQLVIETISEQSDETCAVLFALAGMKASGEWSVN